MEAKDRDSSVAVWLGVQTGGGEEFSGELSIR